MLENPELEMWEFCPDVIFEMWECEQITGNPRNSIYSLISGLKKSFESEFL